jgi:hypothetical protein
LSLIDARMPALQTSGRDHQGLDGPSCTAADDNNSGHGWRIVTVSGFDLTAAIREVLHDVGMQHETLVRCHVQAAPPYATELLRMEGLNGTPLTRDTVKQLWHRAPYVIPLRLVRYGPASSSPEILDVAAIGTRGSQEEYLGRVEQIFARLVEDAIAGTNRGQAELSVDTLRSTSQRSHRPAAIDYMIARWHMRLFSELWSVGLTTTPIINILSAGATGAVQWQPADHRNSYLADPFPLAGTDQLLCEEMPLHGGVGRVVALSPDASGVWRTSSIVLDTNQHHSYPCTVKDGERTLFLPEATNRGGTTLYELARDETPKPICAVALGRRLADPTLFKHDNRYWIACTDVDIGTHDNLCFLYADQPEGPWQPHRCTPVKIDICGARPAGSVFRIGAALFRPGQDCARTYGAAVLIHRIETLTPDTFRESVVARLDPDPDGPFPHGLHTLSVDSERVWVDGKRFVFDAAGLRRKAMRKLGQFVGREKPAS